MLNGDDRLSAHDANLRTLSHEAVERLLGLLAPGSVMISARLMTGSLSNFTHLVEATTASGELVRLVVRRYSDIYRPPSQSARVEYNALQLLKANDMPVPEPLYLDEEGTLMGAPGIVTSFLEGSHVVAPVSEKQWAAGLANALAGIHSIPCGEPAQAILLKADSVVSYFLESEDIPGKLASHPDGVAVWDQILAR